MQNAMKKTMQIPVWKGLLALSIIILLIVFGFILGFRITYAPWLESNWAAIDAVGTWAAVFVSGAAIWAAVSIPKRIAANQGKMTLFEKRYIFYENLQSCISFAEALKICDDSESFDFLFVSCFTSYQDEKYRPGSEEFLNSKYGICQSLYNILKQGEFLFDFEIGENIMKLCASLLRMVYANLTSCDFPKEKAAYLCVISEIENNHIPLIEKALRLSERV